MITRGRGPERTVAMCAAIVITLLMTVVAIQVALLVRADIIVGNWK